MVLRLRSSLTRCAGEQSWIAVRRIVRCSAYASLASSLGFACANEDERRNNMVDEGRLCFEEDQRRVGDDSVQLLAGESLILTVSAPTCLSASCDVDRQAMCSVAQDGTTLTISSVLRWTERSTSGCTDDCGQLTATCRTQPLSMGTHTIRHGRAEHSVSIPGIVPRCFP